MPEKLPKGWVKMTLGEVSARVSTIQPEDSPDTEFTYFDIGGIDNQSNRIVETKTVIGRDAPSRARQSVRKDDILFSTVRTYLKKIARIDSDYPNPVASTGFTVIRAADGVSPQFLFLQILSEDFLQPLHALQTGTSYPAVRDKDVFTQPIRLAPSREQERIVAKLEALLLRVAAGEAAARRALDRLQRYHAAVLHAAVTGELTRDWRKSHPPKETGTELLSRLLNVRRSKNQLNWLIARLERFLQELKEDFAIRPLHLDTTGLLRSLEMLKSFREKVQTLKSWDGDWAKQWDAFARVVIAFPKLNRKQNHSVKVSVQFFRRELAHLQSGRWMSDCATEPVTPDIEYPQELPDGWQWASVHQLAAHEPRSITDGPFGSHLKSSHYTNTGPRVIRLQNIGDGVFIDEMAHISRRHYELLKNHAVYPGDLVIRALGIPAPRACRIPAIGPAIVKADCIRFKVAGDFIDSSFVLYALNSPTTQHRTERKIHGVGRPRLNLGEIKAIAIPLPSQNEQKQISLEIERRLAAADRLTSTLNRQLDRARVTRQSLLREAFAGHLVPQNPNDETASILLERIRAAREAEAKKPKAKRMPKPKSKVVRHSLLEVLRSHKKPISPEQLFRESGFQQEFESNECRQEIVDKFYEELRAITGPRGQVQEKRPNRNTVLLEVKS